MLSWESSSSLRLMGIWGRMTLPEAFQCCLPPKQVEQASFTPHLVLLWDHPLHPAPSPHRLGCSERSQLGQGSFIPCAARI